MPLLPSPEIGTHPVSGTVRAWPARVPLRQAATAQTGAVLLVVVLAVLFPGISVMAGSAMSLALLQGVIAAVLGRALCMDPWWLPINVLFVPGLVWILSFNLPPVFALAAFCLLASLYWGVARTRVPLFLSSRAATAALVELLPRGGSFSFLDLGCGLASVITRLARARPSGQYSGIESAPVPYLLSRLRVAFTARACRIAWGDFNDLDLRCYDIVYAYLSPAAMTDVWRKASNEMRPGSLLISNSFAIPGVQPAMTISTGLSDGSRLLLWRM
jgi:hypothetical protein